LFLEALSWTLPLLTVRFWQPARPVPPWQSQDRCRGTGAVPRLVSDATRRDRRACTERHGRALSVPSNDGSAGFRDRRSSTIGRRARPATDPCRPELFHWRRDAQLARWCG